MSLNITISDAGKLIAKLSDHLDIAEQDVNEAMRNHLASLEELRTAILARDSISNTLQLMLYEAERLG